MTKTAVTMSLLAGMLSAACLASTDAAACGESLFRVGKGVTYRAHTAPLPGRVLIVAETEAHRAFAERLAAAGHSVKVVADPTELEEALATDEFDVVLAQFHDRDTVASQFAATATHATYLPVTSAESEKELAESMYDRTVDESDKFTTFLKAIHRVLKQA